MRWVPCGKCMNCRINKKRLWTGRIVLEARYSKLPSTFLTLTYNDEHEPERHSLNPLDLKGFLNRLRGRKNVVVNTGCRYFAVGEYGDTSWRPHYHLALFGMPPDFEREFESCWIRDGKPMGFIKAGELTPASAGYIAGYCTKKMTSYDDPRLIDLGLIPEFNRMSRFPPLGAAGMEVILDNFHTLTGARAIAEHGDVPTGFRLDGKEYPIGSYWRAYLREQLGIDEPPEYEPWNIDLEAFEVQKSNAQKKAEKLWEQNKRRRHTPTTI